MLNATCMEEQDGVQRSSILRSVPANCAMPLWAGADVGNSEQTNPNQPDPFSHIHPPYLGSIYTFPSVIQPPPENEAMQQTIIIRAPRRCAPGWVRVSVAIFGCCAAGQFLNSDVNLMFVAP
jgi:hypothetical protein